MKKGLVFLFAALAGTNLMAATLHVDLNSTNPTAPYATRETAATNIQTAVTAAAAGDTVQVWDGHYLLATEISVSKAITVQSANGPETTVVDGQGTVRCFNLGNSACVVEGLTITNGYDGDYEGGGIYCSDTTPVVTNCTISGNWGRGMYHGTANNCILSGNQGGCGMYGGTANHCTLSGNSGGGMARGTANHCIISGNSGGLYSRGGGMSGGTANHCIISGNTAAYGGGMYNGTANHCILSGNSAYVGGGVAYGAANNCIIEGNYASDFGGGSYYGTLTHCTISGNISDVFGGGTYDGTLSNCIVYANTAYSSDDNWFGGTFTYCCTTPLPEGVGNISDNPILLSTSHIHPESPCVGAGSLDYAAGTDIDGEAWGLSPSMGCDEPTASFDGMLSSSISMDGSNIALGYELALSAEISGELVSNRWTFGDGAVLLNTTYAEHVWAAEGIYDVVLTAWNDDYPDGVSGTSQVQVDESIYYVDAGNPSPAAPYTSWETAATSIQDAVDAAEGTLGSLVLVADGFYDAGGAVTPGFSCMNRVVITNDITVQSVNGPEYTLIVGEGPLGSNAVRGVYMSSGILSGFTITNGHTMTTGYVYYDGMGGGVNLNGGSEAPTFRGGDGLVTNCVLIGNVSSSGGGSYKGSLSHCSLIGNSASSGGGSYYCTLGNCLISGNSASSGGGMYDGTANNCTLSGNTASTGGGMYKGTANNCIVYGNTALQGSDLYSATVYYSCSPDAAHGVNGNITNAPAFVDAANGDYRLAAGSPCIDAGSNAYVSGDSDLAGNPRIVNGIVDMGAYEFQMASSTDTDSDRMNDSWEQEYFGGLDRDGAGDYDADGLLDLAEYISGTDPTDASSSFTAKVGRPDSGGFVVEWTSVEGRTYSVFWSLSLDDDFELLQDGIECPQNSYTDTVHSAESAGFYQIEVRLK